MRRPRSVAPRQSKLAPANSPWTMAASATFHANGPATSRVAANGTAPAIGTAPKLGLKPTTPHAAAGKRIDPPVSPPIAAGTSDAAPATPGPLDAPPGSRVRLHGLRAREGWLVGRSADREFPAMQLADDDRTLDRIHASHGCHSGAVADGVAAGACTHAGAGRVERRQGGGEKRQIARAQPNADCVEPRRNMLDRRRRVHFTDLISTASVSSSARPADGSGLMKSMSPASRAATRAESLGAGANRKSSHAGLQPQ